MKTNNNFFSKLSKATLIVSLAFTTLISVSCQNAARQSFHYKTDFVKQMVYQVSNEFLTRTGIAVQNRNTNEAAAVLVNYTVSEKNTKHTASYNESELGSFLTSAAKLNAEIATEESTESDNTLDFLTSAAQLNAPVAEMEIEADNTLEFLTAAAQLTSEVAQDNTNDETFELLINAAQLNTPVATEESSQDDLLDFLTSAAGINSCVVE
jgi:hypothetical protein